MRVLALDPGGSTGVAFIDADKSPITKVQAFESWQLTQDEHHAMLRNTLDSLQPDVVVCERFEFRQLDNADLRAREYIGVAKLWTQDHHKHLAMQSTGSKTLWSDNKLKQIGLYRTAMPHANDAVRHLLYYVTVSKKDMYFITQLR